MTDYLPTPTLDKLQSLDGRTYAELTPDEITVLNFFCKYGRKYGVTVINKADPHSRVEVINGATAGLAGRLHGNCPDIKRKVQIGGATAETMEQKRVRHEALANAKGATQFQFVVMQDGVDFGCHADFGNGMEPFYPDKEVEVGNDTIDLNTHALAKIGFTLIRGLLEGRIPGGTAPAIDLADALHNFPEHGNKLHEELTLQDLSNFVIKYPEFRSFLSVAVQFPE